MAMQANTNIVNDMHSMPTPQESTLCHPQVLCRRWAGAQLLCNSAQFTRVSGEYDEIAPAIDFKYLRRGSSLAT